MGTLTVRKLVDGSVVKVQIPCCLPMARYLVSKIYDMGVWESSTNRVYL